MVAPWDDYDEDEDWYDLPDEEDAWEVIPEQPQPSLLELWLLGSLLFDLGEWDLFPDTD